MAESLPSVAVALFVKNEFSDIAGWIAWHAALGVKTFLIYDDHSSDGTWEILQAAAKSYDIRLKRTDPIGQPDFYQRQRDSFMAAAAESRHQFDWLGFLDGDEYVYLRHFDNLPEFLRGFKHADAIAFSWRIQGSSNRVVRPKMTTVEAFTQHSNKSLNDNVLVKSFVRPEKMGNEYINPHWFDVATERYVRPSGRYVQSANAVQEIEWSHAFVMHYICRSMEHYIQRIKRRLNVDLSDSVGYWDHFNRNDETDLEPLKLLLRMDRYLAPIYEQMITSAILRLKSAIVMDDQGQVGASVATDTDEDIAPSIFRIRSFFNTYLYYAPRTGQVVHADENYAIEQGFEEVLGCINPVTPKLITLFAPGNIDTFIKFSADPRLMKTIIFEVRPQSDDRIALLSPMQNFFLALLPPESGVGIAEVNRHQADEWEYLSLELIDAVGPETYASPPPFVPGRETTVSDIISWIRYASVLPSNNEFLRVLYSVTPSVRAEISRLVPGLLWNALA